jgi:cbb3-type cytochrome c oxidase subunit III
MHVGKTAWGVILIGIIILAVCVSMARATAQGDPFEGRKIYLTFCFACHGVMGKGNGPVRRLLPVAPRNHTDEQYMTGKTDQDLFNAISGGGEAFHGSRYMPAWSKRLTDEEVWDLVAYLRYLHRPHLQGNAIAGKVLYTKYCQACHGASGRGDGPIAQFARQFGPLPPDFTDAKYMTTRTDLDLFFTIMEGGEEVEKSRYMPAWGGSLSEQEIWDLVTYLRSLAKP